MPGLTNESETHQGIIDQQAQNGSSSSTATAAENSNSARSNQQTTNSSTAPAQQPSADVYIIPDYSISRTHPQHLLVLPFVPHPSSTATPNFHQAPPPHYFCATNSQASTPGYNDPPPEYEDTVNPHQSYINHGVSFETAATGLSQSCSCMTQLTTVADDYGGSNGHHPLHGIYDNGLGAHHGGLHSTASAVAASANGGYGGLDRNEALAASYLYPELLNVTSSTSSSSQLQQPSNTATSFAGARSSRSQRFFRRPPSSNYSLSSTISSTTSTVSSINQRDREQRQQHRMRRDSWQYLTVKKWVIVVLVLMLLMAISLLVGVSLEHFQLLRKFLDSKYTTTKSVPPTPPTPISITYTTESTLVPSTTKFLPDFNTDETENFIPK